MNMNMNMNMNIGINMSMSMNIIEGVACPLTATIFYIAEYNHGEKCIIWSAEHRILNIFDVIKINGYSAVVENKKTKVNIHHIIRFSPGKWARIIVDSCLYHNNSMHLCIEGETCHFSSCPFEINTY